MRTEIKELTHADLTGELGEEDLLGFWIHFLDEDGTAFDSIGPFETEAEAVKANSFGELCAGLPSPGQDLCDHDGTPRSECLGVACKTHNRCCWQ